MKQSKILAILSTAILIALLAVPFTAAPAMAQDVDFDDDEGYVGDDIDISGSNFYPDSDYTVVFPDEWYDYDEDDYDDIDDECDEDGDWSESFEVPPVPGGDYEFTIYGYDEDGDDWDDTFTFTVLSEATVSSTKVNVGDKITVSGTGFTESDYVYIYIDDYDEDDDDTYASVKTKSTGSFSSTSFTIPEATAGDHDLIVSDDDDNEWSDEITIVPEISVSDTEASIGDTITVSGTGFAKSADMTFYLDGTALDETAKTNSYGTLSSTEITIPPVASGKHTLKIEDDDDNALSVTIYTLQSITISPTTGPGDTEITVNGQGFDKNETVNITMAGITAGDIETDASGNFTTIINAIKLPAGDYTIEASDGSRSSSKTFKITNSASLSQESGAVGSNITVTGNGFTIDTPITVKFDGVDIAVTTTNSNGEFSTSFTVPATTAGEHPIVVTDTVNPITLIFVAEAGAKLGATTGNIGTNVTISGNAYAPGSTVTVKYDSMQLATASTDSTGAFSVTVKVPSSKGGDHNITISDGSTVTTNVFTVETKAPPVPTLVSPIDLEKAASKTVLTWEPVSDPSGVTYRLQIADDPDFLNVLVDESGITDSTYTLTEKLKMASKKAPYYWRIKAIDGAYNESSWSAAQTYTIGLPGWAFALIIGGGIILLAGGYLFWKHVINRKFGY